MSRKTTTPEFPYEVFVGITDSHDDFANLALIGPRITSYPSNDHRWLNRYSVRVWGDSENEDWTDEFIIDAIDIPEGGNFQ